jgi:hypothetical protein
MTTQSISLGDFLRILMARLTKDNVRMPLQDEDPWQQLFYALKKENGNNSEFLKDLQFDWDGPAPRSNELAEYIQALHWTGNTSAINPTWETMTLDPSIAEQWVEEFKSLEKRDTDLLFRAIKNAKILFQKAV